MCIVLWTKLHSATFSCAQDFFPTVNYGVIIPLICEPSIFKELDSNGMLLFHSKTGHKGSPIKITSSATKELYGFTLRKRKQRQTDVTSVDVEVTVVDLSSEAQNAAVVHDSTMDSCNKLPSPEVAPGSQMQGPILLNLDSQGNSTQLPVIPPHALSLSGGAQPALVFFVGSSNTPVTGDTAAVPNVSGSAASFANALFFTQPVTLNVLPQETPTSGGVIEKAMELANFQASPGQSGNYQPSRSSSGLMVSENTFVPPNANCTLQPGTPQGTLSTEHSFRTLPHLSQNIVITSSVATGENVPIDNVSQSITVQTSQVAQNPSLGDLHTFVEESKTGNTDTEMASATETDNFQESQRVSYKRRGMLIREVVTQTGGDPEIMILCERRQECGEEFTEESVDNDDTQRTGKKPGLFVFNFLTTYSCRYIYTSVHLCTVYS